MDKGYSSFHVIFFILAYLSYSCHSQISVSLAEPKLTAVTAINSTAFTVTWEFANATYDRSDLIQIWIEFYEFYYNYGPINSSVGYVFISTNKTITKLTRNFELVNAFYFVCLLSNSTNINSSISLVKRVCQLKRTCLRSNPSICPQMPFIMISNGIISSNSFIINIHWLKYLPYSRNGTYVQITNNSLIGTSLSTFENDTYISQSYQFSNLKSNTNYTMNIIVSYVVFDQLLTDTTIYTIYTSHSSNYLHTGNRLTFIVLFILIICQWIVQLH